MLIRQAFQRRIVKLTTVCVACTAAVALLYLLSISFRGLERIAGDWLMTNPNARVSPRNPQLVYLGIDESTRKLDTLFDDDFEKSPTLRMMKVGFPWNRAVFAAVIQRLMESGAKAVVLDVVFPDPKTGDSTFRIALDDYRDHVAIGSSLVDRIEDSAGGADLHLSHALPSASLVPRGPPVDSRVGFVNVRADSDGRVRRVHFRTTLLEFHGRKPKTGDEELFSLAARALEKSGHGDRIPRTHRPLMLRFSEEIRPQSLHEIFVEAQWQNPPYDSGALFKDKIVLIGAIGLTSEDRLQTPFGTTIGPAVHLSAINAALNGDFLHETPLAADLALIAGAGALAWMLGVWVRKPMLRLVILAAALAGYYGVVQWLFNVTGFFPVLLSPLLALGGSGLAWSVWEQVLDLRDKARLRRTFERYVSRDIVKELLDNPQSYLNTLGGQRKQVTVLFSDVRGFTTITESGDEQALVAQLNEYFNAMVNIVFQHHGTLDKFIGDAVMAQWGGIVTEGEKEDACRAVATAVEMRKTLVRLNEDWARREMLELKFGIGVNQGQAIVGNLGCDAKMEVSLIGDAVNTASRFEGMTKQFHVDLLIGENVARLVREKFIVRSVALSQPKGKTKPVEIFTVLDERVAGAAEPAWLAAYEEGVRHFRAREFAAAISCFESALVEVPGDWLIEHYYLEQCRNFAANPPPPEWTPVDVMTSK